MNVIPEINKFTCIRLIEFWIPKLIQRFQLNVCILFTYWAVLVKYGIRFLIYPCLFVVYHFSIFYGLNITTLVVFFYLRFKTWCLIAFELWLIIVDNTFSSQRYKNGYNVLCSEFYCLCVFLHSKSLSSFKPNAQW